MMTQALTASRKRVRSNNCEEECCDFMPLSKRINNLHINNGSCCNGLGHSIPKHSNFKQDGRYEECGGEEPVILHNSPESLQMPFGSEHGVGLLQPTLNNDMKLFEPRQGDNRNEPLPNSVHPWMNDQMMSLYSPDLNATDNPYYYENNKLLFALYMERMQRNGRELY